MIVLVPANLATEAERYAYGKGAVTVSAAVRSIIMDAAEAAQCAERDVMIPGAMILEGLLALMETLREGGPVESLGIVQ